MRKTRETPPSFAPLKRWNTTKSLLTVRYGPGQSSLEEEDAVDLLEETLDEEKATDEKLTLTAESAINVEEEQEEEQEEGKEPTHSKGRSR